MIFCSNCLPSLAESLYSQFIISQDVLDNVCNQSLAIGDRVRALLNCIEGRVDAVHSDFTKVVRILQSDPFLSHGAEMLVKSYCESFPASGNTCEYMYNLAFGPHTNT